VAELAPEMSPTPKVQPVSGSYNNNSTNDAKPGCMLLVDMGVRLSIASTSPAAALMAHVKANQPGSQTASSTSTALLMSCDSQYCYPSSAHPPMVSYTAGQLLGTPAARAAQARSKCSVVTARGCLLCRL
jgi:hypothetical protein